jgi:histidinol-phosphatase (PHP family)
MFIRQSEYAIPERGRTARPMQAMSEIVDTHVHTTDSPDASLTALELAGRAAAAGLGGVGFVAHVDFHPDDFCTGAFSAASYDGSFREAAAGEGGLILLKGVEIGEPHLFMDEAVVALQRFSYDYFTGALHWVGGRLVLDASTFEGGGTADLVEEYILDSIRIASESPIDILAHFGVWRRGLALAGMDQDPDETLLWPGLLRRLFEAMMDRGIALEVNTAGLRRREAVTYPTPAVLRFYRNCGGSLVTLGSDTHAEPHVFFGLDRGAALLRSEGFEKAYCFRDRRPVPFPL